MQQEGCERGLPRHRCPGPFLFWEGLVDEKSEEACGKRRDAIRQMSVLY